MKIFQIKTAYLDYALVPQACAESVTRQTRQQFCRDIFYIFFNDNITILGDMIERLDVTHLL